jgi:hypothetical protein
MYCVCVWVFINSANWLVQVGRRAGSELFFFFKFWAQQPAAGRGLLIHEVSRSDTRRTTVGRTPLDEWSARRRDLYLKTHITHNRHPCPRWDSKPPSQLTHALDSAVTGTGGREPNWRKSWNSSKGTGCYKELHSRSTTELASRNNHSTDSATHHAFKINHCRNFHWGPLWR